MTQSNNTLIVDGYNVIRSTPPYREIAENDLDAARFALISDVAAYADREWRATIVFDGGNNPQSDGLPHEVVGITVVFSKYGTEADTVIESLSRKARERGGRVEVVTSDAQLQWSVLGGTVIRRSASEFADELRSGEAEWREHNPLGSSRSRIEDVLDEDTRRALERWARGKK
jgi:uncharacterized protein